MRRLILAAHMLFVLMASVVMSGCAERQSSAMERAALAESADNSGSPDELSFGTGLGRTGEAPARVPQRAAPPAPVSELAQWQLAAGVDASRPAAERVLVYTAM